MKQNVMILSVVLMLAASVSALADTVAAAKHDTAVMPGQISARIPIPYYPALAIEKKQQGKVVLAVTVSPEGKPVRVKVTESSGHKRLDDAAIKAAYAGAYHTGGKWIVFSTPLYFTLDDSGPLLPTEKEEAGNNQ